jgi:peroxiredoxin
MSIGLEQGQVFPDFTLPDAQGTPVSSRAYYMRRNMIIVALPDHLDDKWKSWLSELSDAVATIPESDVACLVLIDSTDSNRPSVQSPVQLLLDDKGSARSRLGSDPAGTDGQIIITNRHGVIYHSATGHPGDPAIDPAGLPGWIEFIACRCS